MALRQEVRSIVTQALVAQHKRQPTEDEVRVRTEMLAKIAVGSTYFELEQCTDRDDLLRLRDYAIEDRRVEQDQWVKDVEEKRKNWSR